MKIKWNNDSFGIGIFGGLVIVLYRMIWWIWKIDILGIIFKFVDLQ